LDRTKVFATGDDAAAKKTACCIAKVTVTGRTCSTWRTAQANEAAQKKGTANASQCKSASMALLVIGAFMMKLAF
jgi:mRNA-degrading endonuclease toxin of MazEF toxin-antitoxin module